MAMMATDHIELQTQHSKQSFHSLE